MTFFRLKHKRGRLRDAPVNYGHLLPQFWLYVFGESSDSLMAIAAQRVPFFNETGSLVDSVATWRVVIRRGDVGQLPFPAPRCQGMRTGLPPDEHAASMSDSDEALFEKLLEEG